VAGKLVRDKIPEIITRSGRTPHVVALDEKRYRTALHDKLLEEAGELRLAQSTQDFIDEAADVFEVLTALVRSHGVSLDTITAAAQAKRAERGGFDMRLWLEGIEPGTV
jgi:predicted house-cleaning noncanonical NTP pyrophosphatase (MazG superfamily)